MRPRDDEHDAPDDTLDVHLDTMFAHALSADAADDPEPDEEQEEEDEPWPEPPRRRKRRHGK